MPVRSRRPVLTLLGLIGATSLPALLAAQTPAPARAPAPASPIILQHTFNQQVDDRTRVHLEGNTTYRLEIDNARARLRLTPVDPGTQQPLVQPLLLGRGVSGTRLYTVQTRAPGDYWVRVTGGDPARPVPVTLSRAPTPAPTAKGEAKR